MSMVSDRPKNEVVDTPAPGRDAVIGFLKSRNAGEVRHSGKNLLDHLTGVERILRDWGTPPEVQRAGLFHSVYGTEHFRSAVARPAERGEVRDVIGAAAEELAWKFGGLRTESLFDAIAPGAPEELSFRWSTEPQPVPREELRALAQIFAANWLEQFDRMRASSRAARLEDMKRLAAWLGDGPAAALDALYGFDVEPIVIPDRAVEGQRDIIEVWDDAVPKTLQIRISGLMDVNIWRYGWKATQDQTAYGFWHSHFGGDDREGAETDCEHDLIGRQIVAPVLELWRMLKTGPLKGHSLVRVYANAHTFGGDGHLHKDNTTPGHYTTIYYAHPEWEANWAGETVFFDEDRQSIEKAVHPKPGRFVHFPGKLLHAARSPSRECPALRSVIVFKTQIAQATLSVQGSDAAIPTSNLPEPDRG